MNTDGSNNQGNLPVIDLTPKTPLNPQSSYTNSQGLAVHEEAELEQLLWMWKPRAFRTSMAPLLVGVIYIIMPVILLIVGKQYMDDKTFIYLIIFSSAPLPFMALLGITGMHFGCMRPTHSTWHTIIMAILLTLVAMISITGLCYFDYQFSTVGALKIFPIIVGIFSMLLGGMAFGIHMHYKKIVKKVLDNGKLDVFIENFAKSGKKEDCPYYCIKNGSFM